MASIRRLWQSWKDLHGGQLVDSLAGFVSVLRRWHKYSDFRTAIYRGENGLFDSTDHEADTYLISKVARQVIEKGQVLRPYEVDGREFTITHQEVKHIRDFQRDHDIDVTPSSSSWLSLAQHHDVPTRLLDFTRNPLVALFFACWPDSMTRDSLVYFVVPRDLRRHTQLRDRVGPGDDIEQGIRTGHSHPELAACVVLR